MHETLNRVLRGGLLLTIVSASGGANLGCSADDDAALARSGYTTARAQARDGGIGESVDARVVPPEEVLFRKVEAELVQSCGGSGGQCHVNGQMAGAPAWLKGPDTYASLKAYPAIITRDPFHSTLVKKTAHAGPAIDQTSAFGKKVIDWLSAEAVALKDKPKASTESFRVEPGQNGLDLAKAGLAGGRLTFTVDIRDSVLSLQNITLTAPKTSGVRLVQPYVVMIVPGAKPLGDPADNFSSLDQTIPAGASARIGSGAAIFAGWKWDPNAVLRIEFTKLEPVAKSASAGGCKSVSSFQQNAAPVLMGQSGITPTCTRGDCHGGGTASTALDLRGLLANPVDYAAACAQVLDKVDLTNKRQSQVILHVTGQSHAGGQVQSATTFTNAIMTWLGNE